MAPSPSGSQGRCRRGKRAAVEEDCRSRRLDKAKPSQARSRLRCYLESTPAVNLPSRAHRLGRGGFFWRSLIEARQYVPSTLPQVGQAVSAGHPEAHEDGFCRGP
jgi:hypothetical protein